jgi:hypothetical protein
MAEIAGSVSLNNQRPKNPKRRVTAGISQGWKSYLWNRQELGHGRYGSESVTLRPSKCFPLYLNKRTPLESTRTSESGQEQTLALQKTGGTPVRSGLPGPIFHTGWRIA